MAGSSFNPFLADTSAPPIPQAQAWAGLYDGAVGPLIDLSQAAPTDPPHRDFLDCLSIAAESAQTARYGPILGDEELREAYAAEVSGRYDAPISAQQVAITAGCNQAFFVTLVALARAGDAVILPAPWYFNHEMSCRMLGVEARMLACHAENGFLPDVDDAARLMDGTVRALVLVTPNNPTGAIYPPELIERFRTLCAERGVWLVIDETYRDFLAAEKTRPHGLFDTPDWGDTVIQLYSFSKAYCIAGHRLGAITASKRALDEIGKVLDCVQICAPRAPQKAVTWALGALNEWREENREKILGRAARFRDAMTAAADWRIDAMGAYFAYVRHPFTGTQARAVAERLAVERGVLCMPGPYFGPGQEQHLRLAFANVSEEALESIAERLAGLT